MNQKNKINLIGVYLLIFLLCLIVIPIQVFRSLTFDSVLRSLIYIGSAGGLGGTIYCIRSYYKTLIGKPFDLNYGWWYIYRPFVSIVVGVFVYFLIVGGLLTLTVGEVSQADLTKGIPFYCAVAFLGGFSFTQFADKITELAETIFATTEKTKEAGGASNSTLPDHSQRLKEQLEAAFSLSFGDLKKISDNAYGGTSSTAKSETQTQLWVAKIETFASESNAKSRYDQLISEKKADGYNEALSSLDFSKISFKEHWTGNKPPTSYDMYYNYESDIKQTVLTTLISSIINNP
jgi:hypothetical protein